METQFYPWPKDTLFKTPFGIYTIKHNLVQTVEQLEVMKQELIYRPDKAYDSETSGLHVHLGARICGHAFAYIEGATLHCYYVPIRHVTPDTNEVQLTPEVVTPVVRDILSRPGRLVGHHLKFDLAMLRADGISAAAMQWDCTMVQSVMFDENAKSFKLKRLAASLLNPSAREEEEELNEWMRRDAKSLRMAYKKRSKNSPDEPCYMERFGYSRSPVRLCGVYACRDVAYTLLLQIKFKETVLRYPLLYQREMGMTYYIHNMEWQGLPVDVNKINEAHNAAVEELEYWDSEIKKLYPDFIPTDDFVRELLYERLGIEVPKRTDKDQPSVDKEARALIGGKHPNHKPFMKMLDARAKAEKARSTYTGSFLRLTGPDNTIHPKYNQTERKEEGGVPVTGRLSSSDPNAQNMTSKPICLRHCACKKCAKEKAIVQAAAQQIIVRSFFTVPRGYVRAFVDFSQIELRALAWFSQDPTLLHCYANDLDVHQITADEVTAGDRNIAKQVNFGNSYGMTKYGLAIRLPYYSTDPERALADAEVYLQRFFAKYAGIPIFKDKLARYMRAHGNRFVNPFGRPRHIWQVGSDDPAIRRRGERMMMSSIISGTCADLMKDTFLRSGHMLSIESPETLLVQTVHDEIAYDIPIPQAERILPKIMKCFTDWPIFEQGGVPIRASCELSTTTWADKREIEILPEGGFKWAA